jgi:3-oxoadipate enol-lactonase
MIDAELVEHADHHAPDLVARPVGARQSLNQEIQGSLAVAGVERGERVAEVGSARLPARGGGPLERDPRGEAVGGEASRNPGEDLQGLVGFSAGQQHPRERDGGVRARRLKRQRVTQRLLVAALHERVRLGREQRVHELLDGLRRLRADELGGHLAVPESLDRRDALDPEVARQALVCVDVDLGQLELSRARGRGALQRRTELTTRPAPLRPEVDDDRKLMRAVDDRSLEICLGDVHITHARTSLMTELSVTRDGVGLAVEDAGAGTPVVLLHGLTATRRYVVMGSSLLERTGHRVVAYDARGHGKSSPASDRAAYRYEDLVADLEAVLDALEIERAVLAGASMGAHTLLRFALEKPERVLGLVAITPAFDPMTNDDPKRLARWDALADGLERGGVEGFIEANGQPREGPWQDTVVKVIRQRLSQHEHPGAVADALRVVPRSHPFEQVADLGAIAAPTAVVASDDEPDPGHPREVGEGYAAVIPGAKLITDRPGHSPIPWQGSQLSKVIAEIADQA